MSTNGTEPASNRTGSRTTSFGGPLSQTNSTRSSKRNSRNDDFINIDMLRKELYEKGLMSPQKPGKQQSQTQVPAYVATPPPRSRSVSQTQLPTTNSSSTSLSPLLKQSAHSYSSSQLPSLLKLTAAHERNLSQASKKSPRKNNNLVSEFYSDANGVINNDTTGDSNSNKFSELVYHPLDESIKNDQELTNYLLNIDTIVKDLYHQDSSEEERDDDDQVDSVNKKVTASQTQLENEARFETKKLQPLLKTLEAVNKSINTHDFQESQAMASMRELNQLFGKLKAIETHTKELSTLLQHSRTTITTIYRPEIEDSVNKLNDLVSLIDNLEYRLNKIRINVKESKNLNDYYQLIEHLEYVDSRFYQHNKETRKTRFKQLNVLLSVAVVGVSVWMYWWGFRSR